MVFLVKLALRLQAFFVPYYIAILPKSHTNYEVKIMDKKPKDIEKLRSPMIDGTMPHQISSPSFKNSGIKVEPPFINKHGVVIGDSFYDSANSPLNNWSVETDPAEMAGAQWIHPTNDIGWNTTENIGIVEAKQHPQAAPFMHPTLDVSKGTD